MSGILGCLLETVNVLGGVILWALIGKPAWRPTSAARWARVLAGSVPCGIAFMIVWIIFAVRYYEVSGLILATPIFIFFAAVPISILEIIRRAIDEEKSSS